MSTVFLCPHHIHRMIDGFHGEGSDIALWQHLYSHFMIFECEQCVIEGKDDVTFPNLQEYSKHCDNVHSNVNHETLEQQESENDKNTFTKIVSDDNCLVSGRFKPNCEDCLSNSFSAYYLQSRNILCQECIMKQYEKMDILFQKSISDYHQRINLIQNSGTSNSHNNNNNNNNNNKNERSSQHGSIGKKSKTQKYFPMFNKASNGSGTHTTTKKTNGKGSSDGGSSNGGSSSRGSSNRYGSDNSGNNKKRGHKRGRKKMESSSEDDDNDSEDDNDSDDDNNDFSKKKTSGEWSSSKKKALLVAWDGKDESSRFLLLTSKNVGFIPISPKNESEIIVETVSKITKDMDKQKTMIETMKRAGDLTVDDEMIHILQVCSIHDFGKGSEYKWHLLNKFTNNCENISQFEKLVVNTLDSALNEVNKRGLLKNNSKFSLDGEILSKQFYQKSIDFALTSSQHSSHNNSNNNECDNNGDSRTDDGAPPAKRQKFKHRHSNNHSNNNSNNNKENDSDTDMKTENIKEKEKKKGKSKHRNKQKNENDSENKYEKYEKYGKYGGIYDNNRDDKMTGEPKRRMVTRSQKNVKQRVLSMNAKAAKNNNNNNYNNEKERKKIEYGRLKAKYQDIIVCDLRDVNKDYHLWVSCEYIDARTKRREKEWFPARVTQKHGNVIRVHYCGYETDDGDNDDDNDDDDNDNNSETRESRKDKMLFDLSSPKDVSKLSIHLPPKYQMQQQSKYFVDNDNNCQWANKVFKGREGGSAKCTCKYSGRNKKEVKEWSKEGKAGAHSGNLVSMEFNQVNNNKIKNKCLRRKNENFWDILNDKQKLKGLFNKKDMKFIIGKCLFLESKTKRFNKMLLAHEEILTAIRNVRLFEFKDSELILNMAHMSCVDENDIPWLLMYFDHSRSVKAGKAIWYPFDKCPDKATKLTRNIALSDDDYIWSDDSSEDGHYYMQVLHGPNKADLSEFDLLTVLNDKTKDINLNKFYENELNGDNSSDDDEFEIDMKTGNQENSNNNNNNNNNNNEMSEKNVFSFGIPFNMQDCEARHESMLDEIRLHPTGWLDEARIVRAISTAGAKYKSEPWFASRGVTMKEMTAGVLYCSSDIQSLVKQCWITPSPICDATGLDEVGDYSAECNGKQFAAIDVNDETAIESAVDDIKEGVDVNKQNVAGVQVDMQEKQQQLKKYCKKLLSFLTKTQIQVPNDVALWFGASEEMDLQQTTGVMNGVFSTTISKRVATERFAHNKKFGEKHKKGIVLKISRGIQSGHASPMAPISRFPSELEFLLHNAHITITNVETPGGGNDGNEDNDENEDNDDDDDDDDDGKDNDNNDNNGGKAYIDEESEIRLFNFLYNTYSSYEDSCDNSKHDEMSFTQLKNLNKNTPSNKQKQKQYEKQIWQKYYCPPLTQRINLTKGLQHVLSNYKKNEKNKRGKSNKNENSNNDNNINIKSKKKQEKASKYEDTDSDVDSSDKQRKKQLKQRKK